MDKTVILLAAAGDPVGNSGALDAFFRAFMFGWILLAIGAWLLIRHARTADLKRRAHRRLVVIAGLTFFLFACVSVAMGFPAEGLALVGPALILISWLNWRFTTFCDGCTRMIYNQFWWHRMRFCPYCGTQLAKPI